MSLQRPASWSDGVTIEEAPLFLDMDDTLDWSLLDGPGDHRQLALDGQQVGRFRVIDGGRCRQPARAWPLSDPAA